MPFDFDQNIDRRNTNSYKWDVKADELLMWVADMDFGTAPAVVDAIEKRLRQGAFGYNTVPDSFRESISGGGRGGINSRWKRSGSCIARVSFRPSLRLCGK